jgi:hypothetical protein
VNTGENKQRIRQRLVVRCGSRILADLTIAVSMGASNARAEGIAAHIEELNRYESLASTLLGDLREAVTALERGVSLLTDPGFGDSPEGAVMSGIVRRLDRACVAAAADVIGREGLAAERAFRTAISSRPGTLVRCGPGPARELWALRSRLGIARRRAGIRPGVVPLRLSPRGRLRGHPAWPHLLDAARRADRPHTLPPFALVSGIDENVDSVYEIWSGLALADALATLAGKRLGEVLRLPAPGSGRLVVSSQHVLAEAQIEGRRVCVWLLPRFPPRELVTEVPERGLMVKTADTRRRQTRGGSQALTPDLVVVDGEGTARRLHVFDTKNYSGVGATGRVSKALGDLWRRYANYLGMLSPERHAQGRPAVPCVDSVIALHPQAHPVMLAPTAMDRDWPAGRPRVFGLPLRPGNEEDRERLCVILGTLLGTS